VSIHGGAADKGWPKTVITWTAGGAHIDDAAALGHLRYQACGTRRVAGVQDRGAVHGPHHREIFQGYLRRPSAPISTPAWEPHSRMFAREIADIRMKS